MKKSLLALAVLGAFAGAASAQSSVTLSGGIDAAIQRQNGDWNMSTGNSGRTNFTLSGREDLGGGMYAFFTLNHRFNQGTGAAAQVTFWRQTWVGLGGGFGNVRLGRMLPVLQTFNGDFDPFGTETVGSTHTGGLNAGIAGNARINNAIYYTSPSLGGLTLHANIAAGDNNLNAAGGNAPERPTGLGVNYAAGPLRVALAYDRNGVDGKTTGLYGSFNAGFATFMAQWEKGDGVLTLGNGSTTGTTFTPGTADDASVWSIGARVPMGASTLKAGYRHSSDLEQKKIAAGLDYSLSKRTIVYADVAKQSGDGYTSAAKKAMFDVGIWHKF
jgi:predicted porin